MGVRVVLQTFDGEELTYTTSMRFTFLKEAYTPFTKVTIDIKENNKTFPKDCKAVKLQWASTPIHYGFPDTYRVIKNVFSERLIISSRGFTSLLTENQLSPGMYTNMSIKKLMQDYIDLPNIKYESNDARSYIYIKRGTPMWDGIANLSYKLTGRYPYIRDTNQVMISMPRSPRIRSYTDDEVISFGTELSTARAVSHFHMEDINGTSSVYNYTEDEAVSRDIIRHRFYELDYRFLNDPNKAGEYRDAIAMRGFKRKFFVYNGYKYEDINDIVTYGDILSERVKAIKMTGNENGIFTEISVYEDKLTDSQ